MSTPSAPAPAPKGTQGAAGAKDTGKGDQPPQHSTAGHGDAHGHRWIYIGSMIVLVGMIVWGLVAWRGYHTSQAAKAKAEELRSRFVAAGLPTPLSVSEAARLFGTDGGAVCDNPGNALNVAQWQAQFTNGAGGPGQRPILSDPQLVLGESLIIQTYCPEKLDSFQDQVDKLKLEGTIKG